MDILHSFCYCKFSMLAKKLLQQKVKSGLPGPAYWLVSGDSNTLADEVDQIKSGLGVKTTEVIEILPEDKKNGEITIEKIRLLRSQLSRSSTSGRRLVVIHQTDRLSEAAANSFLKTLEEPPKDTLIVMLSSSRKIIPTIASRCQLYQFPANIPRYQLYTVSEIEKLASYPLKELFILAEKTVKKGESELLIADLTKYYYDRFKTDVKALAIISYLILVKKHFEANVSERLVIENILLLIYSELKYGTRIKNN